MADEATKPAAESSELSREQLLAYIKKQRAQIADGAARLQQAEALLDAERALNEGGGDCKALERERDAALDARDAAEEKRQRAEAKLRGQVDAVKEGAKGALEAMRAEAEKGADKAVADAVDKVKAEAKARRRRHF